MPKKHTTEKISYNIELDEKLSTHVRSWKFQRAGWVAMLLTVGLALFGLCGNGPLSYRTQAIHTDTLEYEYFLRYMGHAQMCLHLQKQTGITRIAFPMPYWKAFQVEKLTPEPFDTELRNDSIVYFFKGFEKGLLQFYLIPETRGTIGCTLTVNNERFSISHFIYP